ncbi:MAG: PAS domain-containing protein [Theionarchaea archaeon]|nr:PAS domain-containing protein [Theionarchaea archaeon]
MIWQQMPYTIPFVGVSLLSFAVGGYIWFHYRSPLGKTGSATILASSAWIITTVLALSGGDLSTQVFWKKMQFPGIVVLPAAWFIFAVLYTGREQWLNRRTLAGLLFMPVVTVILVFTNESHNLIWKGFTVVTSGLFLVVKESHGIWLQAFIGYAYVLLMIGGLLFFIQIMRCSYPRYRRQTSFLLFGGIVPWAASALSSFGLNPIPYLDFTLIALTLTNLVVAFNIFYFQLGSVVPLARETIIESMDDCVIVLDMENRIVDMNPSARKLMGSTAESLGKPVKGVWPPWPGVEELDVGGGKEVMVDNVIFDVNVSPLVDWRGYTVSRVVVLRDVTDRKRSEKIKQSLKEKEILLQEIHHRVKNNIQIISSLLNLQSSYIKDERYKQMLRDSQDRIKSMALIHEKLYQSSNLADISFGEYIQDLVQSLYRSYGTMNITLEVQGSGVSLGIDTAIPCGLIINELVSNSLKHAFPDDKGKIRIGFRSIDGDIELVVSDNGVGIPDTIDFRTTESLGLHLVTILVEDQLKGTVSLERNDGTTFTITFKK